MAVFGSFLRIFTCTEKLDQGTKKGADKKAETDWGLTERDRKTKRWIKS